jgi:hypothetical protein
MKTTKVLSAISFALIILGVTAGFSKITGTSSANSFPGTGIIYHVNIHPAFMPTPCTTYLVEVVDQNRLPVAPPQAFRSGDDKYVFVEKFSRSHDGQSTRIAMMVPVEFPGDYVCANPLVTPPDVMCGPFIAGQVYTFNLFPENNTTIRR